MFFVILVRDKIRVVPEAFALDREVALTAEIERRYVDKIVAGAGLCVSFYSFLSIGDAVIFPSDGSTITQCTFQLVVFRPFVGEVLRGRVAGSSASGGVRMSVEFFENIIVKPAQLPQPVFFNEDEGVWVWMYNGHELFIDTDEIVTFRVQSVEFNEDVTKDSTSPETLRSGMRIEATFAQDGLGLKRWWSL